MLPAQCEVRECLQPYSPTTASNGAILPTVGDCLELRNQLTTDAYPLTLPLNSRQATLVLRQLSAFISLSYLLLMGKNPTFQEFRPAVLSIKQPCPRGKITKFNVKWAFFLLWGAEREGVGGSGKGFKKGVWSD